MDTIYIIGIVVFGIIAICLAVVHYKSNITISGDAIEKGTDRVIDVIETVLGAFDFNYKTKKSIQETLQIVDEVSHYIAKNLLDDNEDKVTISLAAIEKILIILNAKPKESEQKLVKIVLEEAINYIEKSKK